MSSQISPMLALSTAHLTEDTCNRVLPRLSAQIPAWPKGEFGWFLYSGLGTPDLVAKLPGDLLALLAYAQGRRCDYIMLDRDWPVADDLRSYAW